LDGMVCRGPPRTHTRSRHRPHGKPSVFVSFHNRRGKVTRLPLNSKCANGHLTYEMSPHIAKMQLAWLVEVHVRNIGRGLLREDMILQRTAAAALPITITNALAIQISSIRPVRRPSMRRAEAGRTNAIMIATVNRLSWKRGWSRISPAGAMLSWPGGFSFCSSAIQFLHARVEPAAVASRSRGS
jgi:hypothetical protein